MSGVYLDASAVVKLFKPEPESVVLEAALVACPTWTSSELLEVEALCALHRAGAHVFGAAEAVLARIELIEWSAPIRERAGMPFAKPLRALDAIHAATALSVREDLDVVYVYDAHLSEVLAAEGLTVDSPGA